MTESFFSEVLIEMLPYLTPSMTESVFSETGELHPAALLLKDFIGNCKIIRIANQGDNCEQFELKN